MVILRGVRNLLIINLVVFVVQLIVPQTFEVYFGLVPAMFLRGYIYQIVTYMFLHGGFFHIIVNMYVLWLFGSELEFFWGTREFMKYYFITGVGAGLIYVAFNHSSYIPVIGASGAIFGLLLAFGMLFPERELILFIPLPIRVKAKYLVFIFGGIELLGLLIAKDNIAHLAHLGGLAVGYLYLRWKRRRLY